MIQKQIIYLPVKVEFVFTPEQLNEYTANVIKQSLEIAAEKAEREWCSDGYSTGMWKEVVNKQLIINIFDNIFKKFKV